MKPRKVDFLSRRPMRAVMLVSSAEHEYAVARKLPQDYIYEDWKFYFPAGFWESYFVNDKEYNIDGNRSLEEQKELIIQDLAKEGFKQAEAEEFINALETHEGSNMLLNFDESYRWLKRHPEFKNEAMQKLHEAEALVKKEASFESGSRSKRK